MSWVHLRKAHFWRLVVAGVPFALSLTTLAARSALAEENLSGNSATSGTEPPPAVAVPDVSDPMLTPALGAPRVIASWEDALNLIRTQSPQYITDLESIRRAEAQSRIVLAAVLPTLNGQLGYTHQFLTETLPIGGTTIVTPPADVLSAGGTLSWAAVNPRALYAVGTSKRNVQVTKLSVEDQRRQLTITVVNAMLATAAASRVAELNRVGLRAALERLALANARLKFGQGTPLDVDRGNQDVESARALLINGDEALRRARENFGQTLGSAVPFGAPSGLDLETFERAVAKTCRLNNDIEQRPDVRAARQHLVVVERTIHDAELQLAPSLNVVSQAGYATAVSLGPKTQWSVGAVLNFPFYDGGARYGFRRDAIAATEQARQTLLTARVNAVIDSARAARDVGVEQASRDVALRQRDLAQRIDQRTRGGYAGGLGTSLDLVVSAQSLRQAEINLVIQEYQLGEARANAVLANAECVY